MFLWESCLGIQVGATFRDVANERKHCCSSDES